MAAGRAKLIWGNSITRPADTTAYASADLVANSTVAGSVTPFTFSGVTRNTGYRSKILRAGLVAGQALLTNGTFRLHLFTSLPTVGAGDNSALAVATNFATYIGWYEIVLAINAAAQSFGWSSQVASGAASQANFLSATSTALFGLLEARAAYVPASAQTFQPVIDVEQY